MATAANTTYPPDEANVNPSVAVNITGANGQTNGVRLRPGIYSVRISGSDFDGGDVTLQYSEDGGTTWRNTAVSGLVAVAAAMTDPVEVRVGEAYWSWKLANGSAAMNVTVWMAYAGAS